MFGKIPYFIFVVIFLWGLLGLEKQTLAQDAQPPFPIHVIVFYLETCHFCHEEIEFIEKISKDYPTLQLHTFEVSSGFQNKSLFLKVVKQNNLGGGVPVTVIGEDVFAGYDKKRLLENIEYCKENLCSNWVEEAIGIKKTEVFLSEKPDQNQGQEKPAVSERSSATIFGKELNFDKQTPVFFLGMVLGLADGINPCMFSVLIFLLTYLLAIGSRKKAVKAGLAFAGTTFVVYFLLMFGLIKVIDILQIEKLARLVIVFAAFFAGAVMIKDYFYYGKWFSLEIPQKFRPKIQALIKKGTIPSAIALAIFSSIVELPCTSVLPLAYVNILATRELAPFWYLVWYNLFFIAPLLVIILGVAFAWAKIEALESFRLKFRKHMRLGAGILLILLAIAFWQKWL